MSYNQPGPYGGQPPQGQPGPYGQQPGPYGAPPPQGGPGYGYPQQAPQGVPPQQPNPYAQPQQPQGYGYPQAQQPGPYGQQPPAPPYGGQPPYGAQPPYGGQPQQPKKKTGLIVGVAVVALAVIAGGVYFLTSGGGGSSDVADSTKGYKLTPAAAVDDYKQDPSKRKPESAMSGEDKTKAEAMGVKNPHEVGAQYVSGDLKTNPLLAKMLMLQGAWGEIEDPEKAIDGSFQNAKDSAAASEDTKGSLVGSPKSASPADFDGALMKCQDVKVINDKADGTAQKGPKEMTMPVCIWADYSTVGVVIGFDIGGAMTNKPMTQDETAALAAKLYNTSRTKI
ncbi:hypothetical protein B1H20_10080 [Streptomyces violaceoruber]|uniref:Uncharacterized protein n=1 Tax=Streptomyces violaceoruber TaxID=1935 RepID=A0A1V0U9P1_STRVN|nr:MULTISPECIES: hypothetical protein [Streptomyces]ARF61718.1 hypothetical protein B1H20_10080 [Streptomyces violaceoruber]